MKRPADSRSCRKVRIRANAKDVSEYGISFI